MNERAGLSPSGTTRVAGVIGNPVRHSLSPVLHNAAFAALGLDWVYLAFEPPPDGGAAAVDAMRALELGGLSVTMPFKEQVVAAVDELSPAAGALGAVNCIRWDGDRLVGENTDGAGFVASLAADAGFDPAGRRCVVVGAGGAGRAVTRALADAGAAAVGVVNRSPARAEAAAAIAGPAGAVVGQDAVAAADLVVNATPLGMHAGDALPVDPGLLGDRHVVADLVYHPARTPLLDEAAARGARTLNGLGMLVGQAALAFEHWTHVRPPLETMRAAVAGRAVG